MKQELLNQYKIIVEFLGEVLGPDYEIVLYDLEYDRNFIAALSHGNINNQKVGNKIPKDILELLKSNKFQGKDFCTHLPGKRSTISVLRNSYMLIRDSDDNLNGLLCIIFDDSRFIKLHDYLMSMAHPLDFIKNYSFHTIHNMEMYETAQETNTLPETETNLKNLMHSTYRDAVMQANLPSDRLNQEERLIIIKNLKELGFFRLKGAVSYAAKNLHCSAASVYRYLSELKS